MTASQRSIVSRALTTLAAILSIWIAGSRAALAQTRIMPLGDSITGSPGCWRALLCRDLQNNGFTGIDFVGTLPPQGLPTITVQTTGGVMFHGQYNTVGSFGQSHSSTASAITYHYTLGAGPVLSGGTSWIAAAQSSGSGTARPTLGDSYTVGGVAFTASGQF